ncbi:MAG: AsmA-like C-terminal region-containing protein [Chloracidobacterium sp.]|nr:AsmA-like C-terminal region-containing protein [Chloracidobacterium sp.]MDW8217692.1 AsmA-like C-terminal region-containing protein [Acidobacteriota bacterium]
MAVASLQTNGLRRWRWAAAGAAVLALSLLLLFAVPRLIPSGWLVPHLEGLLGRALGTPVYISEAQATSFLPLTIVVREVTLGQNRPADHLAGTVRRAEFGIGWVNLFRRRPVFTHLLVTEADLRLAGHARTTGAASDAPPPPITAATTLRLQTGAPTDGDGAFTIEQLTVQNSRLQWTETPFVFERLATEGRVRGREVALGRTTAVWLGGALDASAVRLIFEPERLSFAITGRLTDIAVEQLTTPPETPAVTGSGTFRLDVTGQYTYATQAFEKLGGSGDAALRNGRLTRIRPGTIGRTMAAPAVRIGGFDLGALGALRKRWLETSSAPDAAALPETPPNTDGLAFRQLAFRFALEGTTVKLDGLNCDVEEGRQVTGRGTISLDERPAQIDFDLRFPLTFLTGGGLPPLLDALGERQMIPIRVTGTFERPVVEILGLQR